MLLLLFFFDINDSVWSVNAKISKHLQLVDEQSCFLEATLVSLANPKLTVLGLFLHVPEVTGHLPQNSNLLLVLEQLHLVGILNDADLLLEVTSQQCERTVHKHVIVVKNNVQQNTNKVLFYRFHNHVDVFVFVRRFHPPDHFFIH
jgi:hypothetical protein